MTFLPPLPRVRARRTSQLETRLFALPGSAQDGEPLTLTGG